MKKKIVALILLIPLLLVFTTFSIANVVVLTAPVPVTGIKSLMNEVEYLDVADGGALKIEYEVLPENANNKGVVYSSEPVGGKSEANVEIDGDGNLIASSLGTARIVVSTKDGGYKAGFILEVTSTNAIGLKFASDSIAIAEGERAVNPLSFEPFGALDKNADYVSYDSKIAKVDPVTGEVIGISPGETYIAARLPRGAVYGSDGWGDAEISARYRVTVEENAEASVVVDGVTEKAATIYADGSAEFTVTVANEKFTAQPEARTADGGEVLQAFRNYAKMEGGRYEAETLYRSERKTAFFIRAELDGEGARIRFGNDAEAEFKTNAALDALKLYFVSETVFVGERARLYAKTTPEAPTGLTLTYTVRSNGAAEIVEENGVKYLVGIKEGDAEITVVGSAGGSERSDTATVTVTEAPKTINFRLNATLWGIKDRYAFASKKLQNGREAKDTLVLELASNAAVDLTQYEIVSSDPAIAQVAGNRLSVLKNGAVTITARPKNLPETLWDEYSASVVIDCVDGFNVSDYDSLTQAAAGGSKIVLQSDVMLGRDLTGLTYDEKNKALGGELSTIATTADWSYYRHALGDTVPPDIKVALELKDDLYGNGYSLNAHNITAVTDDLGKPLKNGFAGPLNMVAAALGDLSASVKAQDNIVFLVKNDGVTIDNVELQSRNLTPNADGYVELNDLNYAGTTLEIMGDGVKLINSRVKNGRTAVRIFGGNDPDRKIGVRIESCVMSYAREFILKIGTNKTLASNDAALQPDLSIGGKSYAPRDDNNFGDRGFVDTFLKTDVTVKNSVFQTSGIFSVGIESKFGGSAFRKDEGSYYFEDWRDASGTSYPARLKLEGDVGLYDWKDVASIDSGTLIETSGNIEKLKFDIAAILKELRSTKPDQFGSLLADYNGVTYAHGGIAFYGGGKNYSVLDKAGLSEDSYLKQLEEVVVPLSIVPNSEILVAAAGAEPFRFYMFTAKSEMTALKQAELLENGKAYDIIKPVR